MIVLASFEGALRAIRRAKTGRASPPRDASGFWSRHWHGHLPAWRSVLVNWMLVTDLSGRMLESSATFVSAPLVDTPALYLLARIPFYVLSVSICGWGAVGAWRSLARHDGRLKQRWISHACRAVVASVIGILVVQIAVHHVRFVTLHTIFVFSTRLKEAERPVRFVLSSDRRRLAMLGPITFASADDFRRLLDDYPQIRTVDLSSPGGRVFASFSIADDVKRRALNTNALDRCTSACTVILLAGAERTAPADVRIGFHTTDSVRSGYADGALRAYFLAFGLSEGFVNRAMNTPNASMWYPSIRTLLDEHVLTQATPADDDDD